MSLTRTRLWVAVRVMRYYNSMPLTGAMPVMAPFRDRSNHQFTGGYSLSKKTSLWGLFLIDKVKWVRVKKDAEARENGSRPGRVCGHRPTGAEGAFTAKDRRSCMKWWRHSIVKIMDAPAE